MNEKKMLYLQKISLTKKIEFFMIKNYPLNAFEYYFTK